MRRAVATDRAPRAVGPYSQAIVAGGLVWVSGQIPMDPASGELVRGGIGEQARQALRNVEAVLEAAGSDPSRIVRATVYLVDMADFAAVNEAYGSYFSARTGGGDPPARVCVEVSGLPRGARVEIEAVALS